MQKMIIIFIIKRVDLELLEQLELIILAKDIKKIYFILRVHSLYL